MNGSQGRWRKAVGERGPLLALLTAALLLHALASLRLPTPRLWGDENHYLAYALLDAVQGRTAPVPGTLRFDHRPEFGARVDALLLGIDALHPTPTDEEAAPVVARLMEGERFPSFFTRLEGFRIGLALLLGALTWGLGGAIGLGRRGRTLATATALFFPPLFFHAHALWAELLHACLVGGMLLLLVRGLEPSSTDSRSCRGVRFASAGVLLGFALLTKGTLVPFVPLLLLALALAPRSRSRISAAGVSERLLPAGSLLLGLALVLVPQLIANARSGFGPQLSANRWWNLELGLADEGDLDPERVAAARERGLDPREERLLPVQRASRLYFEAAPTPLERERLARERTLHRLRERGLWGVFRGQVRKLASLLLAPDWSLDQSLTFRHRWEATSPAGSWLPVLDRALWWGLLLAGGIGLARIGFRSRAFLPALLLAYLFAALLLVPFKARFLIPTIPLLALFVGSLPQRPSPSPSEDETP